MHRLHNSKWFRPSSVLFGAAALAAMSVLALVVSWSAGAFRSDAAPAPILPVKPQSVDARDRTAIGKYAKRILRMRAAAEDDTLKGLLPRGGRGKSLKPFVVDAAVGDGKLVYARTTRPITEAELILGLGAVPVEVISRDLATGTETRIFKSRSAMIGGTMTRGGVTAFSVGRISATRRGVAVDYSVLRHAAEPDGARVVASDSISFNMRGFTYCGKSTVSSQIDPAGNVLLATLVATCGKANELTYTSQVIRPDGTAESFDSGEVGGIFVGTIAGFSHGRLLGTSADSYSFGVQNAAPGDFSPLISGGVKTSALSDDGTVAAVIENFSRLSPSLGRAEPFVVFPGGDPDRMVVASRSAGKIDQLKFCGANLFAVKKIKSAKLDYGDPEDGISFSWSDRVRAKYRVLQYRLDGSFVRSHGDTPNMVLAASGCDGGSLALIATRSNGVSLLRYAP